MIVKNGSYKVNGLFSVYIGLGVLIVTSVMPVYFMTGLEMYIALTVNAIIALLVYFYITGIEKTSEYIMSQLNKYNLTNKSVKKAHEVLIAAEDLMSELAQSINIVVSTTEEAQVRAFNVLKKCKKVTEESEALAGYYAGNIPEKVHLFVNSYGNKVISDNNESVDKVLESLRRVRLSNIGAKGNMESVGERISDTLIVAAELTSTIDLANILLTSKSFDDVLSGMNGKEGSGSAEEFKTLILEITKGMEKINLSIRNTKDISSAAAEFECDEVMFKADSIGRIEDLIVSNHHAMNRSIKYFGDAMRVMASGDAELDLDINEALLHIDSQVDASNKLLELVSPVNKVKRLMGEVEESFFFLENSSRLNLIEGSKVANGGLRVVDGAKR